MVVCEGRDTRMPGALVKVHVAREQLGLTVKVKRLIKTKSFWSVRM